MIVNLTQHPATPEQRESGVVDLEGRERGLLKRWLTFEERPTVGEIREHAEYIAVLAIQNGLGPEYGDDPVPTHAMIGGAPYLMAALEGALQDVGIVPVYAFTRREAKEEIMPDGSVRKTQVFTHEGFIGLD